MGTDIHSIAQVREGRDWVIKLIEVANDMRDYPSFGILAGLRSNGTPIREPRGLPEDLMILPGSHTCTPAPAWYWVNPEYPDSPRFEIWLGAHSHSWLTLRELEEFADKVFNTYTAEPYYFRKVITELQKLKKLSGVSSDDVRIVFGFDS